MQIIQIFQVLICRLKILNVIEILLILNLIANIIKGGGVIIYKHKLINLINNEDEYLIIHLSSDEPYSFITNNVKIFTGSKITDEQLKAESITKLQKEIEELKKE